MPLNKAALVSELTRIFEAGQTGTKTQAQVAQELANAVDAYIQTATVTVSTPAGPGTGTLS